MSTYLYWFLVDLETFFSDKRSLKRSKSWFDGLSLFANLRYLPTLPK